MNSRRPIPNVAFLPSADRRGTSLGMSPPDCDRLTRDAQQLAAPCTGMTLIELGVVMSIIAVLLSLVLGLSRHVNEVVKLRRAQADLGEWHETLNTWYLKFGMYPDPYALSGHIESNLVWLASTNSAAGQRYMVPLNNGTVFSFSSLASKPLKTTDPWGTPYFYQSSTNSYELLSCGPNRAHQLDDSTQFPEDFSGSSFPQDPNTDDVYFEP